MDEAQEIILKTKEECDKIWLSSKEVVREAGLPKLDKLEVVSPNIENSEAMQRDYEEKKKSIRKTEDVDWDCVKNFLIRLMLENYHPMALVPLIDVHDQWKFFFDEKRSFQSKKGESSIVREGEASIAPKTALE